MKRSLVYFLGFFLVFTGLGCQTNELKQYEKLKVGMDKGDVIDIMGSPRRSERWHGQDRWTYSFYQEDQKHEKEIHFQEGRATYVGGLWKPEVSAEEQDKANEASNHEVELNWAKQKAEAHAQSSKYFNDDDVHTQIRYVPQFQPVQ